MSAATITSKGQITIPADVRAAHGLEPGDMIEFFTGADGRLNVRVLNATAEDFFRSLDGFEPTSFVGTDEDAIAAALAQDDRASKATTGQPRPEEAA